MSEQMNFGRAPFRVSGWQLGNDNCAHCGQDICNIFLVDDADGHTYPVGSGCVKKVWFNVNKLAGFKAADKAMRAELESRKVEALSEDYQQALGVLKSAPHPTPYFAEQGKTAADYFSYIKKNSANMRKAIKMAGAMASGVAA